MLQQDHEQEPIYIIESKKRCVELGRDPNKPTRSPKNIMSESKLSKKERRL
ncbi:hypothetical protein LGK95_06910 [Clostridium algoriphilum]|uniref:hypothetical protein n=1 Tax=Clostridium algoriphilum TaxID=198347 RepID=UPI001CF1FFB2|nr:hypothetical protein [Clostridium algoriphilum]MCB2293247.1 hypothetical protein [Clostridium algoriphilum]